MKLIALSVLALLVASNASATGEAKPFLRKATVTLLGYDPERSISSQCEARANSARIVRIAILKKQNFEGRLHTYLIVAGAIGAAREICPPSAAPEKLPPFIKPGEALSVSECKSASTLLRGRFKVSVNGRIENDHPDLTAGYLQGIVEVLSPFPAACEPYKQEWAALSTDHLLLSRQVSYTRAQRPCSLWRAAFYGELKKASATGKAKGRTAGLKYLQLRPMLALEGSKHHCTDAIGLSTQLATFEITRIEIEATAKE